MAVRTDFAFELHPFPMRELDLFSPFFNRLPMDPYIDGRFRRRRFSRFRGPVDGLRRLPHQAFEQSASYNRLLGGVKRQYAELEDELVTLEPFLAIVASYVGVLGLDPETTDLGVHQIRILCSPEFSGDPAPEGIHQDGFDWVGIFCVAREHVAGAETRLYRERTGPPILARELQPGEAVFTNDRLVYHYTSPVTPTGNRQGHRDVFVITA